MTERKYKWVIIDEVQKNPKLLDLVHKAIEEYKVKFILTGSSARKLKRGGANLLAGRAFLFYLFPLTHVELDSKFDLQEVLTWGALPQIYRMKSEQDKKFFCSATQKCTFVKKLLPSS